MKFSLPIPFVGWLLAILLVIAAPDGFAQRISDHTGKYIGRVDNDRYYDGSGRFIGRVGPAINNGAMVDIRS